MKTYIYKLLSGLLCLCLLLSVAGCGKQSATTDDDTEASALELDTGIPYAATGTSQGMDVVLENSRYQLLLDPETATVGVYVKAGGYLWKTNLTREEAAGINDETVMQEYMSQLLISYYNSNNAKVTYNSYRFAVLNDNPNNHTLWYYGLENGLRIVYTIGQNVNYTLVPRALSEEDYLELTGRMDPDDAEVFGFYYDQLVYDEIDDTQIDAYRNEFRNFQPGQTIYRLASSSRTVQQELYDYYLSDLGVNKQWVMDAYERIGKGFSWPEAPNFTVPVDFTLTQTGLHVNIPTDLIQYDYGSFRLNSIQVLPFFGTVGDEVDARILIPDGSGALVDTKTSTQASVALPFYGADNSIRTHEIAQNMQQASLPAYGLTTGTDAFVAYVSDGESMGSLECHPKNSVYPFAYVGGNFTIHPFETYASNGSTTKAVMQKYAAGPYEGNITLDYLFLNGEQIDYVDMAKAVRDYLFSDREMVSDDELRFYLETYGMVLRKENFLGYAYNKTTALTTFEQAREMYDILNQAGITDITVRYKNWYNDDYANKLAKIGNTVGAIGGNGGLKEFMQYVAEKGGTVYPNMELIMEKYSRSLSDATWHDKYIEGTMISYADSSHWAEGVTADYERLVVKSDVMLEKLDGILAKMNSLDVTGISLTTVGSQLFSDFAENRLKHRDAVQADMVTAMEKIRQNYKLLVDVGNAYALPYADDVLGISLSCSNLSFEQTEVPFVPIVLHGYVAYAGGALNLADYYDTQLLKSVEYGAGLYYSLNYAKAEMVKNTNYSELYSTNFEHWKNDAIRDYKAAAAVLNGCQASTIKDHDMVAEDVFLTTFDNGVAVVVNYREEAFTYNGTQVPARGFARVNG